MSKRKFKTDTSIAARAATGVAGAREDKPLSSSKEGLRDQVRTAVEQHQMIATAAYFLAERRGFAPGAELRDWVQAEAEITARVSRPHSR